MVICLLLLYRLIYVGQFRRVERISYEYIDKYNLFNRTMSMGAMSEVPLAARYIMLYGAKELPLSIDWIELNGQRIASKYLAQNAYLTPLFNVLIVDLGAGRSIEQKIAKVEIGFDRRTSRAYAIKAKRNTIQMLLIDAGGRKWPWPFM